MKNKLFSLQTVILLLVGTTIYSCKKDSNGINTPQEYSNLPPDIAKAAKWYDKEVSKFDNNKFSNQNLIDWNKTVKAELTDSTFVYAVPLFKSDSVSRELNLNKINDKSFFGVIKEYRWIKSPEVLVLKLMSLNGDVIEEGYLNEDGQYVKIGPIRFNNKLMAKPSPKNYKKSDAGGDEDKEGGQLGIGAGGESKVVITAPFITPLPIIIPFIPTSMPPPDRPNDLGGDALGGGAGTRKIITDKSVIMNPRAACALKKLLNNNTVFDALVKKFTGANYNLTFKVLDKLNSTTSRAETSSYDPNKPQNFEIRIRNSFVNSAPTIQIVKTLLHEAFHANLMQHTYVSFGNSDIEANWKKKPKDMELNELIDIIESKVAGTSTEGVHHEYMAKNIDKISKGLQEFSKKYDSSFSDFTEDDFIALAYEGLQETNYYLKNVKDKSLDYFGRPMQADSVYRNSVVKIKNSSNVDCNK